MRPLAAFACETTSGCPGTTGPTALPSNAYRQPEVRPRSGGYPHAKLSPLIESTNKNGAKFSQTSAPLPVVAPRLSLKGNSASTALHSGRISLSDKKVPTSPNAQAPEFVWSRDVSPPTQVATRLSMHRIKVEANSAGPSFAVKDNTVIQELPKNIRVSALSTEIKAKFDLLCNKRATNHRAQSKQTAMQQRVQTESSLLADRALIES